MQRVNWQILGKTELCSSELMYIHATCYQQRGCLSLKSRRGVFVSAACKTLPTFKIIRPTFLKTVTDVQIEWSCTSIPFT